MRIVFFGSTTDSIKVLEKLHDIVCVVTQPPRPVGRKQVITPTPVESWAKTNNIAVLSFPNNPDHPYLFSDEGQVSDALAPCKADLFITASFGQKIPSYLIGKTTYGGLNVHPSLLPRWRGADPVPWAILSGDHQTGVTILTLTDKFDEGKIIAQKKYPITDKDTANPLRTKLFEIGADLLIASLPDYLSGKNKGIAQNAHTGGVQPYAKRLTREDGYEPWEKITDLGEAERLDRKFRALSPWPGLWTRLPELRSGVSGQARLPNGKRLKIIHWPDIVQLEGKKPVSLAQFKKAYFPS